MELLNPKWRAMCLSWTNDKCLADDLYQELCVYILGKEKDFSDNEQYIFVTLYRIWHDKHQRFKNKFCPKDSFEFDLIEESEEFDHRLRLLENALDRYDDLDAALLECWASGMSYRKIGGKAGVSYRTVHERVKRTKDDIRKLL